MMTSRQRGGLRVCALAGALALSACGGGESDANDADSGATDGTSGEAAEASEEGDGELDVVNVGIIPSPDAAVLYLGEEQGFFSDRGIELEYHIGQGGAALVPPVVSGEYELGFSNVISIMQAREEGLPLTIINPSGTSWGTEEDGINNLLVMGDSGITSPAELNGASVGVNTLGNLLEVLARTSIDSAGGDSDTVEFVELPPPDLVTALVNGDIDATMCNEPFCMMAIEQGAVQIANSFYDLAPGVEAAAAAWFTTDDQLADNPDLFTRLQDAVAESNVYATEHPDETREMTSNVATIEPDLLETMLLNKWPGTLNPDDLKYLAEATVSYGLMREVPEYDDVVWSP